jgi:hypothetical protein
MSRDLGTEDYVNLTRYCGTNHKLMIQLTLLGPDAPQIGYAKLTPQQARRIAIRLLQAATLCEEG